MKIKKICSLGILDININLTLYNYQAKYLDFNINSFNKKEDLYELFQFENDNELNLKDKFNYSNSFKDYSLKNIISINYLDYITLTSDNPLINTLLYMNRASKNKCFIEFIMPNQLEYRDNTKFIKKLIEIIFAKNYFFIVENSLMDIPCKINFIIKIIDEISNEIISSKIFDLFENNEIDIEAIEDNKNNANSKEEKNIQKLFINKINYNFNKSQFFIIDLKEMIKILIKHENIYNILYKIINNNCNIKIILIIDDNINVQNNNEILIIKKLIDLCDIIFCFKNNINNFLKSFYSISKRDILDKHPSKIFFLSKNFNNLAGLDLITKDFSKFRQNIPRLSIIFDEFNIIRIYKQDIFKKSLAYQNMFPLLLNIENNLINKRDFIYLNSNKLYHIFIGGFLSRYIYNKNLEICLEAGKLLMIKAIDIFISKKDNVTNQDNFNIKVKEKKYHFNKNIQRLISKEKHFVLDCTNKAKSQKKEYNILSDKNCLGFLTKKYYSKNANKISLMKKIDFFLKKSKMKDFINEQLNKEKVNSIILNNENNYSQKNIKKLVPFISINDIDKYSNSYKENSNQEKQINLKTVSYNFNNIKPIKKARIYFNTTNSFNKKRNDNNNIIRNILSSIHKKKNYNKILYQLYQPNKNFDNFKKKYDNF